MANFAAHQWWISSETERKVQSIKADIQLMEGQLKRLRQADIVKFKRDIETLKIRIEAAHGDLKRLKRNGHPF